MRSSLTSFRLLPLVPLAEQLRARNTPGRDLPIQRGQRNAEDLPDGRHHDNCAVGERRAVRSRTYLSASIHL